ncbi:MAG TPA: hypothetical protein VM537_06520 [Anaerolineae bacterium]|nr:hypothetical protein [Anaerolineae bacterium]
MRQYWISQTLQNNLLVRSGPFRERENAERALVAVIGKDEVRNAVLNIEDAPDSEED